MTSCDQVDPNQAFQVILQGCNPRLLVFCETLSIHRLRPPLCPKTVDPQYVPGLALASRLAPTIFPGVSVVYFSSCSSLSHTNVNYNFSRTRLRRLKEMLPSRNLCLPSLLFTNYIYVYIWGVNEKNSQEKTQIQFEKYSFKLSGQRTSHRAKIFTKTFETYDFPGHLPFPVLNSKDNGLDSCIEKVVLRVNLCRV